LELPSSCILYPSSTLKAKYRCIDDTGLEASILISNYDQTELLNYKDSSDILNYKETRVGELQHYTSELMHPVDGDSTGVIDMFCDLETCITLVERPSGIYSSIKSQLDE